MSRGPTGLLKNHANVAIRARMVKGTFFILEDTGTETDRHTNLGPQQKQRQRKKPDST